jgi:hypothetical protein
LKRREEKVAYSKLLHSYNNEKERNLLIEPYHQRGCCIHHSSWYLVLLLLFHSYNFIDSRVIFIPSCFSCSCFLNLITSWDKTRLPCLD